MMDNYRSEKLWFIYASSHISFYLKQTYIKSDKIFFLNLKYFSAKIQTDTLCTFGKARSLLPHAMD